MHSDYRIDVNYENQMRGGSGKRKPNFPINSKIHQTSQHVKQVNGRNFIPELTPKGGRKVVKTIEEVPKTVNNAPTARGHWTFDARSKPKLL